MTLAWTGSGIKFDALIWLCEFSLELVLDSILELISDDKLELRTAGVVPRLEQGGGTNGAGLGGGVRWSIR